MKAQDVCSGGRVCLINGYPVVVEQLQLFAQSVSSLTPFEQPRISLVCLELGKLFTVNKSRAHESPFSHCQRSFRRQVPARFSSNSISRHASIPLQKPNPTLSKTLMARLLAVRTVTTTFSHPASSATFFMTTERAVPMPRFRKPF